MPEPGRVLTREQVEAMEAREIYVSSVMERTAIITEDAEWFQAHLRAAFDAGREFVKVVSDACAVGLAAGEETP